MLQFLPYEASLCIIGAYNLANHDLHGPVAVLKSKARRLANWKLTKAKMAGSQAGEVTRISKACPMFQSDNRSIPEGAGIQPTKKHL